MVILDRPLVLLSWFSPLSLGRIVFVAKAIPILNLLLEINNNNKNNEEKKELMCYLLKPGFDSFNLLSTVSAGHFEY